jgi:signal transduction histidine kinase
MYAMEDVANPKLIIATNKTVSGKILIAIRDNGKGIPEEIMDKIFVPFFTTRKGGSGLGLGISREIIRLHHGNIEVESIENKGTTIRLLL